MLTESILSASSSPDEDVELPLLPLEEELELSLSPLEEELELSLLPLEEELELSLLPLEEELELSLSSSSEVGLELSIPPLTGLSEAPPPVEEDAPPAQALIAKHINHEISHTPAFFM